LKDEIALAYQYALEEQRAVAKSTESSRQAG
jgi:hypothetical protein